MFGENSISGSLIGALRDATWTLRGIASVVILSFGGLVTAPAVAAVKQEVSQIQWHKPVEGPGAKLSGELQSVRDRLAGVGRKDLKGADLADMRKSFRADSAALADMDKDTLASFDAARAMIKDKHLPDVIMQRELAAEKQYKTEMGALRQGLDSISNESDDAKTQAKTKEVLDRLSKFQMERAPQKFDPKNLPNRSLKPDLSRVPHTTKKEFAEAGFISNPYLKVASISSNFDYSQLPGASDPGYLAATTEVTLSDAIKAKAAELHNNPVEIYNWVRNNVQWQPTWGAVQDADLTLSAQRGNAFDISSLLIALLRASGIPARYVHGTINVPEAKFRNWVGGFQNINAAVNYASAGGIPVKSLIGGGNIVTVQMEHIWVEAAIDYAPSRGAVNKSADAWVAIDASYKQYTYAHGLNPISVSGVNPSVLAQQFNGSGTVDTTNSYIASLDPTILLNALQTAQSTSLNYINQNFPNATVGQILGGGEIVKSVANDLSASFPYSVVMKGAEYGVLPNQLEQSITFALGADALGEPENAITYPWAQLNNHQIIVAFDAATQADAETLNSFASGDETTISIPAYLVQMTPKLLIDGQVVSTGAPMQLGSEMVFSFTPNFTGRYSVPNEYNVIAGSYLDVAVIAGNVGTQQFTKLQTQLSQTEAILQSGDQGQLQTLNRERILGDLFQAGLLGYYTQYSALAYAAGVNDGGKHYLAAGIGTFGFEPHVDYTFGIPRDVRNGAAIFNVPIINVIGFDGQDAQKVNYALEIGTLSSVLEAEVPNQIFSGSNQTAPAISAITAISQAMTDGQRVYHIDANNMNSVLPMIHHGPQEMQEISDALASGKEAIAHTDDISVAGWSGSGYVLYDPHTGDGAYKIAGGQNGSASPGLDVLGDAIGVVKDVAVAVADKLVLSYIDAWVELVKNVYFIATQCSGLMLASAVAMIAVMSALAFAIPIFLEFTLVFGLIFGWMMTFAIDKAVDSEANLCKDFDE